MGYLERQVFVIYAPVRRALKRLKRPTLFHPLLVTTFLFSSSPSIGQTTQAWFSGHVYDSVSGKPIAQSLVLCHLTGGIDIRAQTDEQGQFLFSSLSPGEYTVRIEAERHQAQELRLLEIPVAGQLDMDFRLRPDKDIWEAGQYRSFFPPGSGQVLGFYGPDVDTTRSLTLNADRYDPRRLETSMSSVIDRKLIDNLPLAGRDAYSLLVLLPGVTADTAVGRGLGYSVIGQRPSAANYLLDGLENNNLQITGPAGVIAPEPLTEYRISTNNYSAEFGRTSGFIANAVTSSGGAVWHGQAFLHLKNEVMDANGFQENQKGIARAPLKDIQTGLVLSGPLIRDRLFVSGFLQLARFHSENDPAVYALPSANFLARIGSQSPFGKLLHAFPAAVIPQVSGDAGLASIASPVKVDQAAGTMRLDWLNSSAKHKIFARQMLNQYQQPGLLPNPYPAFSSPFDSGASSTAAGWTWTPQTKWTQDLRVGRSGDSSRYDRPHSEVPQLAGIYATFGSTDYPLSLPSSSASFGYRNLTSNWEIADSWSWLAGRHHFQFGGGYLWRQIHSAFTADRDGMYAFADMNALLQGTPESISFAHDRTMAGIAPVPYNRAYRYSQFDLFAQDAFQPTSRLSINYGVRYDHFGSPVNNGAAKDSLLQLGPGNSVEERLTAAAPSAAPLTGDQAILSLQGGAWAPRLGMTFDLTGAGHTILKASYGIFYDRPFDNIWQSIPLNRQRFDSWDLSSPVPFLSPIQDIAGSYGTFEPQQEFHTRLIFQPNLKNPMVQSAFLGVEKTLAPGIVLEESVVVSRGRRLWTTDIVNRSGKNAELFYRANQGNSDYRALASTVRIQRGAVKAQTSYTWSRALDNQSDPLAGTFDDFNQLGAATKPDFVQLASFTGEYDSRADWARADFDQRHNLVFFGTYTPVWHLRRFRQLANGWTLSGLGALRSGLPYSVYVTITNSIINQRANLTGNPYVSSPQNVAGGRLLLNRAAFSPPGSTDPGTSPRNGFTGPGLISSDLSLARSFPLAFLGETGRMVVRADAYNFLNHANLGNPDVQLGSRSFGQALYGRIEKNSGFPGLAPLDETGRRIQLMVRVEF